MKRTSTSSSAVKKATGGKRKPAETFSAQSILVPVDFSDPSRSALRYARSLAEQTGGKLILFYALEPVGTPDFAFHPLMMEPAQATKAAELQLQKICDEEGVDESLVEHTVVRSGAAHTQIADLAEKLGADLIVISTHGNTGIKHVLMGSTAERVVRHARCPVLVVRA
jgi:universal stress protein A